MFKINVKAKNKSLTSLKSALPCYGFSENRFFESHCTRHKDNIIFDFGLKIENNKFEFHENYCVVPNSLVISYALATCISGKVSKIFMAGFDGYPDGDIRNGEIEEMLNSLYKSLPKNFKESIISITPTNFKFFKIKSVYTF